MIFVLFCSLHNNKKKFSLIPTCVCSTIQIQVKLNHFGNPRPPRKMRQNLHAVNRPHIEINSTMVLLLPTNTSFGLSLVTINRQRYKPRFLFKKICSNWLMHVLSLLCLHLIPASLFCPMWAHDLK